MVKETLIEGAIICGVSFFPLWLYIGWRLIVGMAEDAVKKMLGMKGREQ